MASYERKQADSLWIDIKCDLVDSIDSTWTNWMASWNITDDNGIIVLSGNSLNRQSIYSGTGSDSGTFFLRIGPITTIGWADLPFGSYTLTMQLDNSFVDYRHEESHKIKIVKQGLMA